MEAYFRVTQKQSGGGSGATITVTYDSAYYGKTITCSDGVTTYTATTTSSGSTTFNVNAEGTWTITCDGTTKTVNVVLSYTTALSITKTITVYSAANDTVSFTDLAGSKTVTTDSSGAGSVSITYNSGDTITFTSSVAKDPSNLSNYYSKQIVLSSSTTEVFIMPDNTLYWYGYVDDNLEACSSANGWTYSGYTFDAPTYSTEYVQLYGTANSHLCGIGTKSPISPSKIKCVVEGIVKSGSDYGYALVVPSKVYNSSASTVISINIGSTAFYEANATNTDIYALQSSNTRRMKVYAFWYEE